MSTLTASPDTLPRPAFRLPSLARLADHPRSGWLLVPWCAVLFFYGLNGGDLYRTEALRAIIGEEFLNSGNWVVPTLYGEPLLTKPAGMYAAIAAVSWPFGGVSDWSARLPSALAAAGTVLLFFWYFRRLFGPRGGLIAGLILPASLMWLDKATTAEIDMLQVFWVAGSVLFFLRALESEEIADCRLQIADCRLGSSICNLQFAICNLQSSFLWWLAAMLCVAGGVLTKWTAPAFFYFAIIPLLWWRGRLRLLWSRNHLLAAALGAALCLLWATLAIRQVGWDVFSNTISQEALQRLLPHEIPVAADRHHQRPYPWRESLGHPFVVLGSTLPWSLFALVALWPGFGGRFNDNGRRLLQALHCWTWPNLLFWSLVPEHAPRHSFPLFPGLTGLAILVWIAWLSGRLPWTWRHPRPGTVFLGLVAAWLIVKVVFVEAWVPIRDGRANHWLALVHMRPRVTRDPSGKAEQVAAHVPADRPLYLFHVKDEGIMFCYGRSHGDGEPDRVVRRLNGPDDLPSTAELVYCILTGDEWASWNPQRSADVLLRLSDQQGDPLVLLAVRPTRPATAMQDLTP